MKIEFAKKKALLLIPLSFLLITGCGSDDDDDSSAGVQQEEPAPQTPDPDEPNTGFNRNCRRANEIPGSNFQYTFDDAEPTEVERLAFDTTDDKVRISFGDPNDARIESTYSPVKAEDGTVGSYGEFRTLTYTLQFPVLPFGTVPGSSIEYVIAKLFNGEAENGDFLCSKSLLNEFE